MKIGINNIFTSLWFLIMFCCGGALSYMSFDSALFTSDVFFLVKFFVGLIILITIGVFFFFCLKFRLLIIRQNILISLNPFIFSLKRFDMDKIKKIKWSIWNIHGTYYRTIELTNKKKERISFSDFEFENFDSLVKIIPNFDSEKRKFEIDYEQAKSNITYLTLSLIIHLAMVALLVYVNLSGIGYHWIHIVFYSGLLLLMYATQKRRRKYKQIINSNRLDSNI